MIPDYQTLMHPVLALSAKGTIYIHDAIQQLADQFELTDEERTRLVPSGRQRLFYNRLNWAKSYLKKAGLLDYPARGYFAITKEGQEVLRNPPERIDTKFLSQHYPSFQDFRAEHFKQQQKNKSLEMTAQPEPGDDMATPEEQLGAAYQTLRRALADELLDKVRTSPPDFFERLIIELLGAMGYGVDHAESGRVLGKSGDDGIDGVIDQDQLGVDQIYVQAKRYTDGNKVGPAAIRDFSGAMEMENAQKGIFFTTSDFTKSARESIGKMNKRIVLIDGKKLAELMIDYNIGCREDRIIRLKKLDDDFFEND
ncbi:MAG: restriction endonuclease [Pseudomonadota bacterium]